MSGYCFLQGCSVGNYVTVAVLLETTDFMKGIAQKTLVFCVPNLLFDWNIGMLWAARREDYHVSC